MRSSSLLCLCGLVVLFLFIHTSTAEDVFSPVPLMMWTGGSTKFGEGQNLQTLDSSKVEQVFKNALTSGVEVVVVFVEPRMSTENIWETESFTNLQEFTKQSATIYPYVSTENKGVAASLAGVLAQSKSSGKIILAEDQSSGFLSSLSVEKVTKQQLLELLRKSNAIFNNGVTDVVVVNFDSKTDNVFGIGANVVSELAQDDQYIKSVVDAVVAKTNKYLAVFTADKPNRSTVSRTPSEVPPHGRLALRDNTTPPDYTSYFPILMLEVYIAAIVMLIIVFLGILCTCSLQSPARFENPNKHKKE